MAATKKGKLTKPSELPKNLKGVSVVLDTEGTGLDVMRDEPFMVSLDMDGKKQYAVEWTPALVSWLNKELPAAKEVICHGGKFDMHMLIQGGVKDKTATALPMKCTAVRASLINEHEHSFSLENLGIKHGLGRKTSDELYRVLAGMFGGDATVKQMANVRHAPREVVAKYAIGDVVLTRALYEWQEKQIRQQELENVHELEMGVLPVLCKMERRGIPVNTKQLQKSKVEIAQMIAAQEKAIYDMVGFDLNVRSGPQKVKAFKKLGLPIVENEKGNPTFAKQVLETYDHPLCRTMILMASLRQIRDAFIDGFEQYVYEDGKVHTSFNQLRGDDYGTKSGRLSSSQPNMQQSPSPKRKPETAKLCRILFRAPEGYIWGSADWSQFEFRIFGHYTQEPAVIDAYKADPWADFHQTTADLTGVARNPFAKQINLGLIFGMGEGKLAMELGLPYTRHVDPKGKVRLLPGPEAKAIFNTYHAGLPGAREFLKMASGLARSRGWVKTLYGRRLRFPDKAHTYKAGGTIFQGTAADLMKAKLIVLERELHHAEGELILPVHDEFNALFPQGKRAKAKKLMLEIMEDIPELRIPIKADIGFGRTWWDACKED